MSPGHLPGHWASARLDEACTLVTDGTHHSPPNGPHGEYKYVTAKNVRPLGLDLADLTHVSEEVHRGIYARCPVEHEDVLYIKDGVTTGLAAVNTLKEEFSLLSSVALLKPDRRVLNPYFLKHWLNSPATFRAMTRRMSGTAIRRLVLREIRRAEVPIPPLGEQCRIVEALDAELTKLEAAVAGLARTEANLKRYRASVLKAAVAGKLVPTEAELVRQERRDHEPATVLLDRILTERRRRWGEPELDRFKSPSPDRWKDNYKEPLVPESERLPDLPEGWCWSTVDQLGEVSGGLTQNPKRSTYPTQMPYLRVANVYANRLELDDVRAIGLRETELSRVLLLPGDLLVVEGNGSIDQIGRVALWGGGIQGCVHQNHIIKVRLDPVKLGTWVLFWLLSPSGREHVVKMASSTSGLHTLSISKVASLPVPLPPADEQARIVSQIERILTIVSEVEKGVHSALARCNRLRQSVLGWAFSGRLVDHDATDEPAVVLIDRIREERGRGASRTRPERST